MIVEDDALSDRYRMFNRDAVTAPRRQRLTA